MQIRIEHVGAQQSAVLVVEDAWHDPSSLLGMASRVSYVRSSLYYPGVRSPAPPDYAKALIASLKDVVCSTFKANELVITDSSFSLVVTPPERLVPFQRVPHFDSADPNRLAVLHYLCPAERGGGTSFYRHRSTGLESITGEVHDRYIGIVNSEVRRDGMLAPAYVDGDTALFERIARYEARFNRVLIYRGNMLHSVNVPPGFTPDADPSTGRLTCNTFLIARSDCAQSLGGIQ